MTARDEAIQAMASVLHIDPVISQWASHIGRAIDAIPPGVLARLAIEQGGLEDTTFAMAGGGAVYACSPDWNPDEHGHARLYRVVEP